MLVGLGLDAQIAHDFARQKTRGLFTYVKETIKNFFNILLINSDAAIYNPKFTTVF